MGKKILLIMTIILLPFSTSFAVEIDLEQYEAEEKLLLLAETFVVTATKTKKKAEDVPAMVTIITAEQIRNMGARNLLDVLKTVLGLSVSIQQQGITRWTIESRGVRTKNSEKILVLVDGQALNNDYCGGASRFYSLLPVNNIKQIEIVRGSGSAIYGANAMLAVINIITKKAEDVNGIEVKAARGKFDIRNYNILFGKEIDKLKIAGYFDYFSTEGTHVRIQDDRLSPSSPASQAPGFADDWWKKKDYNLNFSYGNFSFWTKFMEEKKGPYIGVAYALNDKSELFHRDIRGELDYNHSFKNDLDLSIRLYDSYQQLTYDWEIFPEGTVLPSGSFPDGMKGKPHYKNNKIGGEIKTDYKIWESNLLTTGFVLEKIRQFDVTHHANFNPNTNAPLPGGQQDITSWGNYNKNAKRQIWAFYLQDDLDLLNKYGIEFLLGFRYDRYSDFGGAFSPRTSLIWRVLQDLDLKVQYSKAFRAPSFDELYSDNNPAYMGDPDLNPERLWDTEAGAIYRVSHHFVFSLNYFHTEIKELINLQNFKHTNFGKTKLNGVEAEIKADLGDGNYGFANYTYQRVTDGGEHAHGVPAHRANLGLNFKLCKHLNSNTTVMFTGTRHRMSNDQRADIDPYTVVNQTFILNNFYQTFEIRASAYNLLDEKYADPAPTFVMNDYPRAGINYMFEVAYKF